MRINARVIGATACLLTGLGMTQAMAGTDRENLAGDALFEYHGCVNCHGANGKNPVTKKVPVLGGKEADYIYAEATKILKGERTSEEAKLMHSALAYQSSCDYPPTAAELKKIGEWLAVQ